MQGEAERALRVRRRIDRRPADERRRSTFGLPLALVADRQYVGRRRESDVEVLEIVAALKALHETGGTVLVAIDGPGGSGKTVLAESLQAALERANVSAHIVEGDAFFLPSASRAHGTPCEKPIGGDFDWCRLRDQVLE